MGRTILIRDAKAAEIVRCLTHGDPIGSDPKWVGILANGTVFICDSLNELYSSAEAEKSEMAVLFHSSKPGQLRLRCEGGRD